MIDGRLIGMEPTLQPVTGPAVGPKRRRAPTVLLSLLLAAIATTAVRIEILNAQAGRILPIRALRDDGTPGKWRQSVVTDERRWRQLCGPRDAAGEPAKELTEADRARMQRDIQREISNGSLRDLVESWGLAQYALVPLAASMSLFLLFAPRWTPSRRWFGACGLAITGAAAYLMFHRAYLSSLGW